MKPIYHKLRIYRRGSPLVQDDIAVLLGKYNATQISRHETNPVHPQIELGLLYEILFDVPIATLFSEQKQSLVNLLKRRIPNILHELACLDMSESVNLKMDCLHKILLALNQNKNL